MCCVERIAAWELHVIAAACRQNTCCTSPVHEQDGRSPCSSTSSGLRPQAPGFRHAAVTGLPVPRADIDDAPGAVRTALRRTAGLPVQALRHVQRNAVPQPGSAARYPEPGVADPRMQTAELMRGSPSTAHRVVERRLRLIVGRVVALIQNDEPHIRQRRETARCAAL